MRGKAALSRNTDEATSISGAVLARTTASRPAGVEGSGLGLSIVKAIVERHGGPISVHSEPDIGTTCTIELSASAEDMTLDSPRVQDQGAARSLASTHAREESAPRRPGSTSRTASA